MSRTNDEAADRNIATTTSHIGAPALALALVLVLAPVGCGEPGGASISPEGPWLTWRSEYVTYHARPDDSLADESDVRAVESKLVELWDFLGVEPAARAAIEWYRFRDVNDWQSRDSHLCPGASTGGCTRGATIFGPSGVFEHEVVHAALHGASAPPELLAEGIALAFSCLPEENDLPEATASADWRTALHSGANIPGAKLVMRLLRETPSDFLRWYRSIAHDAGADEIAAAFQSVYEASLDDVWRLAQSDQNQYHCAPFWACRHPAPDQRDFELSRGRGGADSGRLLPNTATMLRITEGAGRIALRRCDGQQAEGSLSVVSTSDTWVLPARQRLAAQVLYELPATLSIAALSADTFARCDAALPLQVPDVPSRKPMVMAAVDEPQFLSITTVVRSTLRIGDPLPLLRGQDGWFVDVCARCENGQALDCTTTGGAEVQAPVWLRMTRDATAPAAPLTVTLGFH